MVVRFANNEGFRTSANGQRLLRIIAKKSASLIMRTAGRGYWYPRMCLDTVRLECAFRSRCFLRESERDPECTFYEP
jgi:hypothetical protein